MSKKTKFLCFVIVFEVFCIASCSYDRGFLTSKIFNSQWFPSEELKISRIDAKYTGAGFTKAPKIIIEGGGGTGAQAIAEIDELGSVSRVTMQNHGSGYTSEPKVRFEGDGDGLVLIPKMRAGEPGTRIPLKISTYGIMLAISFLFANFLLQKEFTRLNISTKLADNIIISAVIGGIAGSKIFYAWEVGEPISFSIMLSGGGLTWYGGFIVAGSIIAFLIVREGLKFSKLADIITPALAAGYGFGRLGCLFSGDGCFGQVCPTNLIFPLGMAYPDGAVQSFAKVYNTPFYESAFSFLMFAFFWKIREKEWPNGFKFSIFLILHSLFRYLVEFIRRNPRDVFGITQAQFIAICVIGATALFFLYRHKDVETLFKRGEKSTP